MANLPFQPAITVLGEDGVRFRYFAVRGDEYPAGQIGWVLIVDGTKSHDPQVVSTGDIVGDLASMSLGEDLDWMLEILRAQTQDMLDDLVARERRSGVKEPGLRGRIRELREEVDAIPRDAS